MRILESKWGVMGLLALLITASLVFMGYGLDNDWPLWIMLPIFFWAIITLAIGFILLMAVIVA